MEDVSKINPLGHEPITKLMVRFAVPSIIGMMVSAVYNIADQIFIGQAVGTLGNAATNIAFPLAMSCTAIALLFGIGGASNFNLNLGRGKPAEAIYYVGNAIVCLIVCGSLLCVVTELFLHPMLRAFGSPADVMPYAVEYVRVVAFGYPFLIFSIGGSHLIRADGSPRMAMMINLSGAIVNIFLDALFIFGLKMGMTGAALATVIGQVLSASIAFRYVMHYKTVKLERIHLTPDFSKIRQIAAIGLASFINQLAMMVVQITLNNSLKFYGAQSVYGESIPIACAGIVMKTNQLFFSVVIGLSQGTQPIESFNYGARNFSRVKKAYMEAAATGFCVSGLSFILFQTVPRQIIGLFGNGSEEYFRFGVSFFRTFLFFTWLNCLQPITSTFFTSIGKAKKGMFLSLTRQILFLLPLIVILPRIFGIEGILYAGPAADLGAAVTAILLAYVEFKDMDRRAAERAKLKT